MDSKEIRKTFIDFFAGKGHQIVSSAPMVVKNDPTLMFTNAGMNQFKDIFLGNQPAKYLRVADTQKCLRVSGKHNDLEEVGHDTYHHTMFEMLGNWSFGDYFKEDAIKWAWELLHDVLKIPADRMFASVFEGSADDNLDRDDEAFRLWSQFLPAERIINGNKKDNFWEMGDTGPCGPCSEIHVDLRDDEERAKVPGQLLVNKDNPLVIEIWNLVFIQFNRKSDGKLEELPDKHVDTGMGFERLCMVLQGKKSNYDTDVFQTTIAKIADLSKKKYGDDPKADIAMRVIADHLRAISFSIADGQLPSNNKAGYVIRRILRRAVRYGYTFLGFREPFICKLVETLKNNMGDAFPELVSQQVLIEKVVREEEESFLRTLETGIRLLDDLVAKAKKMGETEIGGENAFLLYDTFGFPFDLTSLILREKGLTVDEAAFNAAMGKQKERARNAAAMETGDWNKISDGDPLFVGYDETETSTRILSYRKVKQKNKEFYQIILSKTPFYAEMGGQVGDSGWLDNGQGEVISVFDTKRENNLAVHLIDKLPSNLESVFTAKIDLEKRTAIECNHSATHLMHESLREVLGAHVEQKGSFVSHNLLRFDFSHFQKMTDEEIRKVERSVTAKIRANLPVIERRNLPIAQAKEMGAVALFGEKYGEEVRVIGFGSSIELCGGTHISSTGRIGTFRIVGESAIAAGVRRIEAVTAIGCEDYLYMRDDVIRSVRDALNNAPEITVGLQKLVEENSEMRKMLHELIKEKTSLMKRDIISQREVVNGINVFKTFSPLASSEMIKDIAFQLKGEYPVNMFFVAAFANDGRPSITVMISDDLVQKGLNASNIVREAAKHIQGGGGGHPHFATAGGKNPVGLKLSYEAILELVPRI